MWISLTQLISQNLKKSFDCYKRILIILTIIIFFVGNYHICNYFYPLNTEEHINMWWVMKMDIYALIVALCFILATIKRTTNQRIIKIEKFITSIGLGLAASNVIDRHLHNIESYAMTDIMTVSVVFLVSIYNYKLLKKPTTKDER